jgi:hypothetical protein
VRRAAGVSFQNVSDVPMREPLESNRGNLNGGTKMGISTSLVLIAAGAILKWAVSATTSGVNLHVVGVVLMVVGAVGLVLSLIFWSSWGGFGGHAASTTTVVHDHAARPLR